MNYEPLRVLQVTDSLHFGGGERHVVELSTALVRRGYSVTVACSVRGGLWDALPAEGVAVRPLMRRLVKRRVSLAYAWKLRRLIRQGGFDIVHSHMYASAVATAVATLGTGVPFVHTEHSEAAWRGWRARLVSRWVYRRATRMIAVTGIIRERMTAQDAAPPGRVGVIPGTVQLLQIDRTDALARLPGKLWGKRLVGVVARLMPEKGVATFVEAAARLALGLPGVEFIIVGDGPLRPELEALSERLGSPVHFLGFRPDARSLISLLDVLAVPSVSEGTPLVILEALSSSVPVVATRVGGIPEQLRHGVDGLLVPPSDPVELAEALSRVLTDVPLAKRLGESGPLAVASRFSHDEMVRQTIGVYVAALGKSQPAVSPAPQPGPACPPGVRATSIP